MDTLESNINGDHQNDAAAADHGWHKVTYAKRQRKQKQGDSAATTNHGKINGDAAGDDASNVFRSLEQKSEDRRRRIVEAQRAANAAAEVDVRVRSKHRSDDEEDDDYSDGGAGAGKENGKVEEKKVKQKKPKKPKVSVAEAADKIDAGDLAAFLADISVSYAGQQDIQMMRMTDYYGRAFSAVSSSQFPWVKTFRESPVAKIIDIPVSHISDDVYKTSVDWINQRPVEALSSFVLWSLDSILADLASQQGGYKGSKKGAQQGSSKSQVAIFLVLAMVLRRKPDALVHVLPALRDNSKYQGHDKLPLFAWMIAQASQGDLAVGLYSWSHNLLPVVSGKNTNPQSRDIMLQLVEKILSAPKARTVLVNGAVRKGERLVPPSVLEILMKVTFPASSARVKATERFEVIYPTLKEVALAGATGSKAMKQVSLQILDFAIKAAGENNPDLSKEAAGICIWCLTQNADCYKQWDKISEENLEASIAILKRISEDWKELSLKLAPLNPLKETLKNLRQKNEKALASKESDHQERINEADKYCKVILGKSSRGGGCMKAMGIAVIGLAVGAAIMSSPNMESWDLKKLSVAISSQFSQFTS